MPGVFTVGYRRQCCSLVFGQGTLMVSPHAIVHEDLCQRRPVDGVFGEALGG